MPAKGILRDLIQPRCCMISPVQDLEAALLALPRAERARIAARLLTSLDEDADVEEAWKREVRNRLERYRAGELEPVSSESVHEEARRRLKR